ncbi:YeeE/YedE family protein [Pseudoduganella sp. FT26W]|uniref:YeeE/YedE family protein n=1 Tax=Duganella aquatilis TaxID=2666082 RepID=A0A844D977_9BURK|nr:YeeE/YedE family protein [Duganella aquatilis]MRW87521.1 YeeE/YedE family protein [Duganella aquatilis]
MQLLSSLMAGLVFGLGLIVSGMTDPEKVQGFLDLKGWWDPSLGLVMLGAILVGSIAFQRASKRERSFLGDVMQLPIASNIERRLVLGSLMFGVGWGLAGFCPGPALASLLSGGSKLMIFTAAMVVGMAVFEALERRKAARQTLSEPQA